MELANFINDFSLLFEEKDKEFMAPDAQFRSIPEWGSLKAMSLIAMVDMNYDIQINGNDIRNCKTINDLFEIVKSKK
jgi:acyl carrier protein